MQPLALFITFHKYLIDFTCFEEKISFLLLFENYLKIVFVFYWAGLNS
jgi:hypothetical protein